MNEFLQRAILLFQEVTGVAAVCSDILPSRSATTAAGND
jgi:hypothetical protein